MGAGPGAPSLLAYHALQNCDTMIYDALVNPDILRWARPGAQIDFAGKRGGKPLAPAARYFHCLLSSPGPRRVLRLKGGDR